MKELAEWDSFYLIVGAAAGALIGLQFVVMTLIAARPGKPAAEAGSAFGTPTIVHFGAVLFLSAIVRAPWQSVMSVSIVLGLMGFGGLAYALMTIRRMRKQNAYEPEFEDWFFHALMPVVSYGLLALSAFSVFSYPRPALFAVGSTALLLLVTGIHNSWDAIMYHVITQPSNPEPRETGEGQ